MSVTRLLSVGALIALTLTALLVLVLSQRAALRLSETDIIETYAALYLDQAGPLAKDTDCRAVPGAQTAIRMIVICGPDQFDATKHYEFHVDPWGQLIVQYGPGDWDRADPVATRDRA